MNRRQLLQAGLFSTGYVLASYRSAHAAPTQQKPKIVIIGAGLSGLASAWELRKKGLDVVILEATKRVGGRVLTDRDNFLDGQYTEDGATLIPDNHDLTLSYVAAFDLKLDPIPEGRSTLYYFGKKRYLENEKNHAEYPRSWRLNRDEDEHGLDWFQEDYFRRSFAAIGDPRAAGWIDSAPARKLDSLSFEEYLRNQGASRTAIDMELAIEGGKRDSAALWIAQAVLDKDMKQFYQIRGGNELLPQAFARHLENSLQLGARVTEVQKENDRTFVCYQSNGRDERIEADAVLFSISPTMLRKIEFSPELPAPKRDAIAAVRMTPATKVSLAMKERFWQRLPVDGMFLAYSDTFIESVWDLSLNQRGRAGILIAYATEANCEALQGLAPEEQIQRTLHTMEQFLPGARANFVRGSSFSWQDQDWVGGAWASYTTGQLPTLRELARPETNLFFAGDHTSMRNGWMQGAFESAQRVVGETTEYLGCAGQKSSSTRCP
jgi:monoamine oxidase